MIKLNTKYILINGAMLALLWLGMIDGIPFARNIALFYLWVIIVVGAFVFVLYFIVPNGSISKPADHKVSPWLRGAYIAGALTILVGSGYIVTAVAYLLAMLGYRFAITELSKAGERAA